MHTTNRREFLQTSLAVAAAAAAPVVARAAEDAPATPPGAGQLRSPTDVIVLGPQKITVSRMAVGTGTYGAGHSSNQLRKLGAQGVADMLTFAFEKGLTFWDTSDSYGTHAAIKLALKKVSREKIAIVTKTPAVSAANLKADLDRFLQELGTDFIDIVLLHSRMRADWDVADKPLMDVLAEAKESKKVRSVGISIHSLDAMKTAAKSKWLDVCMVRLNPANTRMDAPVAQVMPAIEELKTAGKGVIQIKTVGEGTMKSRLDEALTFALHKSPAHCFSIGCESVDDIKDNLARMEKLKAPPTT
jgi:1-deoxyxylulose-5-phosphate synthase